MGAQAAALLDAGGPVGDVPADPPGSRAQDGARPLPVPAPFGLRATALLHGGVGLAPTAWDGTRLHLRLPDPVVVEPAADGLVVRWRGAPPDDAVLRRVLGLEDDLEPLWAACDRLEPLRWVRAAGAGRVLRSATVWQDLVGALAATRASYRATQGMLRAVVGDGPFPGPEELLGRDLRRWGFREPRLRALAERVAGGEDPERLRDPALRDDEVAAAVRELPGLGPFSAAQLLPLLGRPRPPVLDGWLAGQVGAVGGLAAYAPAGRWAGTAAWLAAVAPRLRGDLSPGAPAAPAATPPGAAAGR